MRSLIADLLDQGRIDAGTLTVSPELAALAGLLDQTRSTFLSGGGRHTLRIDLPPVMADPERIVQVLNNLLSNAAKHSPETSPVRVAAARDGVHVTFTVPVAEDSGSRQPIRAAGGEPRVLAGGSREDASWGRRRPADAAVRPGSAGLVRLRAPHPGTPTKYRASTGPAGPGAAVDGRHRVDAARTGAGRPASHLYCRLRQGRDDCERHWIRERSTTSSSPSRRRELTARVRATLRRRAEPEPFVLGKLVIRYDQRRVTVAGRPVDLTATEYELLRVLSLDAGRAVTYGSLFHPGPGAAGIGVPAFPSSCAPSSRGSATSWATTRPDLRTS